MYRVEFSYEETNAMARCIMEYGSTLWVGSPEDLRAISQGLRIFWALGETEWTERELRALARLLVWGMPITPPLLHSALQKIDAVLPAGLSWLPGYENTNTALEEK